MVFTIEVARASSIKRAQYEVSWIGELISAIRRGAQVDAGALADVIEDRSMDDVCDLFAVPGTSLRRAGELVRAVRDSGWKLADEIADVLRTDDVDEELDSAYFHQRI